MRRRLVLFDIDGTLITDGGELVEVEVEDFTARIFQHEIDHTDGRVYLDRMPDLTTLGYTVVL